ncbi:IS1634 family transposase [Candidatus Saccharibacteria bacterium]|nr:IS1634 family transposase [Candidatus Saccharibacteria bacterium]
MYIEKSHYRTSTRIRIVTKVRINGVWKKQLVKHIGTAQHELDIAVLMLQAEQDLAAMRRGEQLVLQLTPDTPSSQLRRVGDYWQLAEASLGSLYDRLGITTPVPFLRLMVIARIVFPKSKLQTASFLSESFGTSCHESQLYRAMDVLHSRQEAVLQQVRKYTTMTYPAALGYVLYDVTTLYFEADQDDQDTTTADGSVVSGLRKKGYSKDHRGDLPQVVLGLAVNELGMPLSYQVHSGDTYEGHTLLRGIEETLDVLHETELTVVADAGMLSEKNLQALEERSLHYIVGARLKSLSAVDQAKILTLDFTAQTVHELTVNKRRLIVTYSASRAARAKSLREKSVARLKKLIAKGTAVRKHSYLDFSVTDAPKLKQTAIDAASQWDGIKGYVTNRTASEMNATDVIAHYTSLFHVEQSFRLFKSDVRVRPTFHYKPERVEAHVVICMLAVTVMRILEQEVRPLGLTVEKAIQEISTAKAAIVRLNNKAFVVPPAYTTLQEEILRATT